VAVQGNRATGLPTSATPGTPPASLPPTARKAWRCRSPTRRCGAATSSARCSSTAAATPSAEPTPQATFQDALIAPVGTLFDQSQNRSRKIGGKISYERPVPGFEALTAIVGFDALWDKTEQRLIATNRVWVPPTDFRSFAPFGQLNLKLLDGKLRLAGASATRMCGSPSTISPRSPPPTARS
jgi:iron complex outermembrane receptor protein